MGINKKGGKKFKKKKNIQTKNIMVFKECIEEQYAKVTKMLGNCNIEAKLLDNTTQFCVIPGSMKKKKWIKVGDIILIAIREYQHSKADVLFVYSQSQIETLINNGDIPSNFIITEEQEINDIGSFIFENDNIKNKDINIIDLENDNNDTDINLEDI